MTGLPLNQAERLAFTGGVTAGVAARPVEAHQPDDTSRVERWTRLASQDRVAFQGLLAFMFVLFVRPQDTLPFLAPLHLADLTAIFALVALVAGRAGRGAPVSRITPELFWVLAFAGVMLATAPFSVWPGGAVAVFTDLYVKVILVFGLIINTVTTRERLERFVNVVVAGTSYVAVRAVIDYGRGVNLVEGGRVTGAGGLFGNPNDMALNMVAFLPLAVVLLLGRRPVLRLIALVGIPAITLAIIFSKSRGGIMGLVPMLVVLLYQMRRLRPGFAAVVVAVTLGSVPLLPSSFTDRMASIFNPEEDPTGSREARKRVMREGYQAFLDNPILGLGAGQFQNYLPDRREQAWRETHNAVLQVASEMGIFGLIAFVMIIWTGFAAALRSAAALRHARVRRSHRARAPDPGRAAREQLELYAAGLLASLTGWFIASMFASVAYYWTLYLVLGLAAALHGITRRELGASGGRRGRARRAEAA